MDDILSPDMQLEATHILASLNPVFLLEARTACLSESRG